MDDKLEFGLVKWFDNEKGFGVIQASFDQEYFLHISQLLQPNRQIEPLDIFLFKPKMNDKNNRLEARGVRRIHGIDDFDVFIRFFPQPDSFTFEIPLRDGKDFIKKAKRTVSLRKIALDDLVSQIGIEKIEERVLVFLEHELDKNDLLSFMELFTDIVSTPRESDLKRLTEKVYAKFSQLLDAYQKFEIWKNKKFFLLGLSKEDEFSLSIHEFAFCFDQLEEEDLKRIAQQETGSEILPRLLKLKFGPINDLTWEQAVFCKKTLRMLPESIPSLVEELDLRLFELELQEVNLILEGLPPIQVWDDFVGYGELMEVTGLELSESYREKLMELIKNAVRKTAPPDVIGLIWLKGKLSEISVEEVFGLFLKNINDLKTRKSILNKLNEGQLLELFERLIESASDTFGFQFYLNILHEFVKEQNPYKSVPSLLSKYADEFSWDTMKFGEAVKSFRKFITENTEMRFKIELFKLGHYFSELEYADFLTFENLMEFKDWERLFQDKHLEEAEIIDFLTSLVVPSASSSVVQWVLEMASKFLQNEKYHKIDQLMYRTYSEAIYVDSWLLGFGKIIPREYLIQYCSNEGNLNDVFTKWASSLNIIQVSDLFNIYLSSLSAKFSLQTKKQFDKYYQEIQFFLEKEKPLASKLRALGNPFFNLLAWHFDTSNDELFDFEYLKDKFIYFEPSAQTTIVKRLFYLKETGAFDLTLDHLNSLTRVDGDLYRLILANNPSEKVDISTDVIIKFMYHLGKESRILMDRDILSIIFTKLGNRRISRAELDRYFPKCEGRTILRYSFKEKNGNIFKVPFKDNFYIGVNFPITGPYFRKYVEEIKQFPVRKWNPELQHWGIPAKYIGEVKEFAARNKFFIRFTGNKFKDNPHLTNRELLVSPSGVSYCEGRKSIKKHQSLEIDFWWCRNDECFKNCEPIYDSDNWSQYTLLDFLRILNIATDEQLKNGSVAPKGNYYKFVSTINRMKQLLDVLYCRTCDEVLHPVETSNFAAYYTTRFACVNNTCEKHNEEGYLTHCLNARCALLIDSRDSKKCSNGMYICKHCTCCCSLEVYKRRATNLQKNGRTVSSDLRYKIENKVGHLDKREHFCYRCGNQMVTEGGEEYECKVCYYEVDLSKYKFTKGNGNKKNSDDDSEDLPF